MVALNEGDFLISKTIVKHGSMGEHGLCRCILEKLIWHLSAYQMVILCQCASFFSPSSSPLFVHSIN